MFTPREEVIEKVIWDGEGTVEIHSGVGVWAGSKAKDFWGSDDKNWQDIIKQGARIKLWTIQYSRVIGFQIWHEGKWLDVWCNGNDFQTKAERETSEQGYCDFIENEGKKIAGWIDEGKSLEEIGNLIDDDHTGNTYGIALSYGIGHAENKEKAKVIRDAHNKKYGQEGAEGVVNPAILTISTSKS